jgi:iron complex transport system substrate-binding protein
MLRVVSLIPSATEIVAALGFESALVGRSHECDFPASVTQLPVCTEPKLSLEGSSAEINERVKSVLEASLSVYRVHTDRLEELRPDIIVTQSQCEVCAVSLHEVEAAVRSLVASQPKIVSLEPNSLADVWTDIGRVAEALVVPDRGKSLIAELQARLDSIAERAAELPSRPASRALNGPIHPWRPGNWVPELVQMAGGHNCSEWRDSTRPGCGGRS